MSRYQGIKFGVFLLILQIAFLLIFGFKVKYTGEADAILNGNASGKLKASDITGVNGNSVKQLYPMFQDVQMMMFLGFGFLMTFLCRYGFSAVGLNFLICGFVLQWGLIIHGCFHLHDGFIEIGNLELLTAEFTVASVLISFGAVIGKTSPLQLLVMALFEVVLQLTNEYIGRSLFLAVDMGDSIFVHLFGAYFGLSVSIILYNSIQFNHQANTSIVHSELFAMLGSLLLWVYWPSFNSAGASGDGQHRAVINTIVSLSGSVLSTFITMSFLPSMDEEEDEEEGKSSTKISKGKFDMIYVQNATLAGGVGVGAVADMMIQPWGALLIGVVCGCVSTLGFRFLANLINRIRILDTCGVHNLHGIPGLIGGIASVVASALATRELYGDTLYQVFPALTPKQNTTFQYVLRYGGLQSQEANSGLGRTANLQACYQLAAIAVTLGIAILGGLITGLVMRVLPLDQPKSSKSLFNDVKFWDVTVVEPNVPHSVIMEYDIATNRQNGNIASHIARSRNNSEK